MLFVHACWWNAGIEVEILFTLALICGTLGAADSETPRLIEGVLGSGGGGVTSIEGLLLSFDGNEKPYLKIFEEAGLLLLISNVSYILWRSEVHKGRKTKHKL